MIKTLGMLEFRSIAKGIEMADVVSKAAEVELIFCKTICPGKFMILISGEVGAVKESIERVQEKSENFLLDSFLLPRVHEDIIVAIKNKLKVKAKGALGIFETSNVVSGIFALDKTLKSAEVKLLKLSLGMAIGGKCYFVIFGDVSSVEEGIREASNVIEAKRIISCTVIPSPCTELVESLN